MVMTMTLIGKLTSLFVFPLFLIWFIFAVADASATPVNDCDQEQLSCSDFHEPSVTDDPFGGGLGILFAVVEIFFMPKINRFIEQASPSELIEVELFIDNQITCSDFGLVEPIDGSTSSCNITNLIAEAHPSKYGWCIFG